MCKDTGSSSQPCSGKQQEPRPRIAVVPGEKDFGTRRIGDGPAGESVIISNVGDADLEVTGVGLADEGGSFTKGELAVPATLAPSASATLAVSFEPASPGAKVAELSIDSTDPDTATETVGLTGQGLGWVRVAVTDQEGAKIPGIGLRLTLPGEKVETPETKAEEVVAVDVTEAGTCSLEMTAEEPLEVLEITSE